MTGFLTMMAAMIALALAFVLVPLTRARKAEGGTPQLQSNLLIHRDQLKQLQAERDNGTLSAAEFEAEQAELGKRVLDDALATLVDAVPAPAPSNARWIAAIVAVTLPASAVGLYLALGSPAAVAPEAAPAVTPVSASEGGKESPHGMSFDQIRARAATLAARLKDNPADGQGWATLARSYNVLGRFPEAAAAYEKAVSLLPSDAQLLADYADALAMSQGQKLDGKPLEVIQLALKADPANLKALALAGTAAFERRDYRGAVGYWDRVVKAAPADSDFARSIASSLDEARALADGRTPRAALPSIMPVGAVAMAPAAVAAATHSGTVTVAPQLASRTSPGDTVFIFARAAQGSRMPLAILSRSSRELPLSFTLDDSSAMAGGTKLSGAGPVMVVARISRSGNATAQLGDLEGSVGPLEPGARDIRLTIDRVLP
jgi:cytochrome c-type biogenesis protein CcmH